MRYVWITLVLFASTLHARSDFGLYIGKGVWPDGRQHLQMFFNESGYRFRTFTAAQILQGELDTSGIRVLVMPGGESIEYLGELGRTGGEIIKRFVDEGHGYAGICAGAFYATSDRIGGVATGPYGIGLLDGTAYDGTNMHTPPFIEGMMDFNVLAHPLTAALSRVQKIVMFEGPSFRFTAREAALKNIQVMMNVQEIDEPTMLTLKYGQGRVFLSGPHPEIEEDRTTWGYVDPESDWPLLREVFDYLLGPDADQDQDQDQDQSDQSMPWS